MKLLLMIVMFVTHIGSSVNASESIRYEQAVNQLIEGCTCLLSNNAPDALMHLNRTTSTPSDEPQWMAMNFLELFAQTIIFDNLGCPDQAKATLTHLYDLNELTYDTKIDRTFHFYEEEDLSGFETITFLELLASKSQYNFVKMSLTALINELKASLLCKHCSLYENFTPHILFAQASSSEQLKIQYCRSFWKHLESFLDHLKIIVEKAAPIILTGVGVYYYIEEHRVKNEQSTS